VDEHTVAGARRAPRRNRRTVTISLLASLSLAAILAPAVDAYADPTPGQIEAQIDAAWNKLEPLIEDYNDVHTKLQKQQQAVQKLAEQIRPLQLQVDLAMSKTSAIAVEYYKGGNASVLNAMLSDGSPAQMADRLSMLDQMARVQQAEVANVTDLKAQLETKKKPLDDALAALKKQDADLAARKKAIDKEIERLNGLRLKAYGQTDGIGSWRPVACPQVDPGGKAGIVANYVCHKIGSPYLWAAAGPDKFDCSGLALAAWAQVGVYLPHNAYQQYKTVPAVSEANLRPGDLVFYYSDVHHMAVYVGNGWVVHAPQTGDHVRMRRLHDAPVKGYGRPAS
jgi:cell wall-associated NlpC family hydrolase